MRTAKDQSEQKAIDDVTKHGLHIIQVFESEECPRFSYTVGLFETYRHPEVIIIGLKPELAQVLLNNMAYDIKLGKRFNPGEFHEDVLDDFPCYFGEVSKSEYRDYVGWDIWFYEGIDFPLLQCVYPTVRGKFVWDEDFPEDARWFCKLITSPPSETYIN